jgi:hypothetical protein
MGHLGLAKPRLPDRQNFRFRLEKMTTSPGSTGIHALSHHITLEPLATHAV